MEDVNDCFCDNNSANFMTRNGCKMTCLLYEFVIFQPDIIVFAAALTNNEFVLPLKDILPSRKQV